MEHNVNGAGVGLNGFQRGRMKQRPLFNTDDATSGLLTSSKLDDTTAKREAGLRPGEAAGGAHGDWKVDITALAVVLGPATAQGRCINLCPEAPEGGCLQEAPRWRSVDAATVAAIVGLVGAAGLHVAAIGGAPATGAPLDQAGLLRAAAVLFAMAVLGHRVLSCIRHLATRSGAVKLARWGQPATLRDIGNVVRRREAFYRMQETDDGGGATLTPLAFDGKTITVPMHEVCQVGEYVCTFRCTHHGTVLDNEGQEGLKAELQASFPQPCTVATKSWTRMRPPLQFLNQQVPPTFEKLLIYSNTTEVTVRFGLPVHCEDAFRLQRFLWKKQPAADAVAAAGRRWCAAHDLTFVEGSMRMTSPRGV